jgi:Ala-tRNA(Pro) deacylase
LQEKNDGKIMDNDLSKMPTSPETLLKRIDNLNIDYELHHHEAVFTVAEAEKIDAQIAAHHTRNMFLRTKKKKNYLVTLSHDTPVDLKKLETLIEAKRFSFGSPDRLMEILGVYPGSVTPLSVINAPTGEVTIILEEKMMRTDKIAVHPLINTMTVTLSPADLLKFMNDLGHEPTIVDLLPAAP